MTYHLTFSTHLSATPEKVWAWMTSIDGISKEMAPYMRMSVPPGVTDLSSVAVTPGKHLFRSWILLFGVIPFDFSDLTLESLEPGVGLVEQSPMGSMRLWRHVRRIEAASTGCILTDELTFKPRFAGRLANRIVKAFFQHRHRMLARYLGRAA
jgi:ligand-binding SRPBCC domain-containing protein